MYTETQLKKLKAEVFNGLIPKIISHKTQRAFFDDMFELILTNNDTSKVTVIPARCGIGKSVFVKVLLATLTTEKETFLDTPGMIIVTDSLDRIHEWQDMIFSFDKETKYNVFRDYFKLTKEQKEVFDKENPYLASLFRDK